MGPRRDASATVLWPSYDASGVGGVGDQVFGEIKGLYYVSTQTTRTGTILALSSCGVTKKAWLKLRQGLAKLNIAGHLLTAQLLLGG